MKREEIATATTNALKAAVVHLHREAKRLQREAAEVQRLEVAARRELKRRGKA